MLTVAMLLSIALTSIGFLGGIGFAWEPDATKILVEPSVVTANVDDVFWVSVNIEKVTDLYSFSFKLRYESGTRVIGAIECVDGGFLDTEEKAFVSTIDTLHGYAYIGGTLLGDVVGFSGDGTLALVKFVVAEAGESVLELGETRLIDSNGEDMDHQTRDGYFDGVNAELVRINIGARTMHVGDTQVFDVKVVNEDAHSAPLYVKARIDNTQIETGKTTTLWAGQSYEYPPVRDPIYLYVDGYTAERQQWTEVGASPFLDAPDDGNYIEGSFDGAQHRWFTFEDIELGDSVVDQVKLWVYCEGPYDEAVDYDVYATGFNWLGSYYGTGTGRIWQDVPRWAGGAIASEMYPALLTEEGINGFEALAYFYDPLGHGGPGNIIDCMRLYVVFAAGRAPEYPVVDGYTAERQQWTEVGASPFLDAPDDGNYIEGSFDGAQHRWFTFEDIELGDSVVDQVKLWVYCEGPYDEAVDYDVYATGFNWLGSYYGTGTGRIWQDVPRWAGGAIASEMYPALLTEEGINGFEALAYFYDPLGHGGPGNIIDAMYLEITFKADRVALPLSPPLFEVQPGQVLDLDPLIWPLQPEDVGTYTCTVTIYYSVKGNFFMDGRKKVITEAWRVLPPK